MKNTGASSSADGTHGTMAYIAEAPNTVTNAVVRAPESLDQRAREGEAEQRADRHGDQQQPELSLGQVERFLQVGQARQQRPHRQREHKEDAVDPLVRLQVEHGDQSTSCRIGFLPSASAKMRLRMTSGMPMPKLQRMPKCSATIPEQRRPEQERDEAGLRQRGDIGRRRPVGALRRRRHGEREDRRGADAAERKAEQRHPVGRGEEDQQRADAEDATAARATRGRAVALDERIDEEARHRLGEGARAPRQSRRGTASPGTRRACRWPTSRCRRPP